MSATEQSFPVIVRDGFDRVCNDFDKIASECGFARSRTRTWARSFGDSVEIIHLHRKSSSYGASRNATVDIRVHFARNEPEAALSLNGPSSEGLRDSRGFAYHLRFNASSWSTYERCIEDLRRIVQEQGLPWFEASRRQA